MFGDNLGEKTTEDEVDRKFSECMANSPAVNYVYHAAKSAGMDEYHRLQAVVIALSELNDRARAAFIDAVIHGMPITEEVADVRNRLTGAYFNE